MGAFLTLLIDLSFPTLGNLIKKIENLSNPHPLPALHPPPLPQGLHCYVHKTAPVAQAIHFLTAKFNQNFKIQLQMRSKKKGKKGRKKKVTKRKRKKEKRNKKAVESEFGATLYFREKIRRVLGRPKTNINKGNTTTTIHWGLLDPGSVLGKSCRRPSSVDNLFHRLNAQPKRLNTTDGVISHVLQVQQALRLMDSARDSSMLRFPA